MSQPNHHNSGHAASVLASEGIANSPFKFQFEVLFVAIFADALLVLWLWKLKFFHSTPWYLSLPEFSKSVVERGVGVAGVLSVALAVYVFAGRLWSGGAAKKPMDKVKSTYSMLKAIVMHRKSFLLIIFASIAGCTAMALEIVKMPPSEQVTVFLSSFSPAEDKPIGLVLSPDNRTLYVADEHGARLMVLGTSPLKIRHVVPMPEKPHRLAISPDGRKLFVTSAESNVVDVIDTGSYKIIRRIPTGPLPYWITITPDGRKVYVSNEGHAFVIDTNRPEGPDNLFFTGNVSVIDSTNYTVINTISNVNFPEGMAVARDTGLLYLASQGGWTHALAEVNILDSYTASQAAEIRQATAGAGFWGGDPVFVIDTATDQLLPGQTITNMEVGVTTAVVPDGSKVYVARGNFNWPGPFKRSDFNHKYRSPVGIIDTTVVGSPQKRPDLLLRDGICCVAVTPDGKHVLAGGGNEIAIIDTTNDRVINRVKLASGANDMVVGADDWVYVTEPGKGLLFAFSLKGLM